jgi:hypothetical protein
MPSTFVKKLLSRSNRGRQPAKRRPLFVRPALETLETRTAPAVSASLKNGMLNVVANTTGGINQVRIGQVSSSIQVSDPKGIDGTFALNQVQQIHFHYGQLGLELAVGTGQIDLAQFPISQAVLGLGPSSLTAAVDATLPVVGRTTLSGSVSGGGQFSLAVNVPTVQVFQVTLTQVKVNLGPAKLALAGNAVLPLLGGVDFQGTARADGTFALTANIKALDVGFVHLRDVSLALANPGGFMVTANAAELPLLGDVQFQGALTKGSFSFMLTVPKLELPNGITVTNVVAILNDQGLGLQAHLDNIPALGLAGVNLTGDIPNYQSFTLTATIDTLEIANLIEFHNIILTLTQTPPVILSVQASANVPVVGEVTFRGIVTPGNFTLSATAEPFTVFGFINIRNATVLVSFPNPTLTVSADIGLGNEKNGIQAHVMGRIRSATDYSFQGDAHVTVAGFDLGSAAPVAFGSGPADAVGNGINIGPFTTLPLPVIGKVTLQGSYAAGGIFGFKAEVRPSPPLVIAGVPFNRFTIGLTDKSLTLGAGVGISFAGLAIGQAFFQGTIETNGDFQFLAEVDALKIAGFQAAKAKLILTKDKLELHATVNYVVATVNVEGVIYFASGQFMLTGTANVGIAGFALSNTTFLATNRGGLHVLVKSHTNLLHFGQVDFNGTITETSKGPGYLIALHGRANFRLAGFALASGTLDLTNAGLSLSAKLGVKVLGFQIEVKGDLRANGTFRFTFHHGVHFGPVSGNLDVTLTPQGLRAESKGSLDLSKNIVFGVRVSAEGSFDTRFQVNPSGTFHAKTIVVMTLHPGDFEAMIGLVINNHEFCIKTSEIGIRGLHPFPDACLSY